MDAGNDSTADISAEATSSTGGVGSSESIDRESSSDPEQLSAPSWDHSGISPPAEEAEGDAVKDTSAFVKHSSVGLTSSGPNDNGTALSGSHAVELLNMASHNTTPVASSATNGDRDPQRPPASSSRTTRGPVARGGAAFGTANPVELPTPLELQLALDDGGLTLLKRLVSPVFFSTDADTGLIQPGLGAIPDSRPLLFVGNHQVDTGLTIFTPKYDLMTKYWYHVVLSFLKLLLPHSFPASPLTPALPLSIHSSSPRTCHS